MLPVLDFSNTLNELDYLASKGFTSAMLPAVTPPGMPKYNDDKWDPVFARAAQLGIVFVLHTGTGLESVVIERGPGAGIINYTNQMTAAQQAGWLLWPRGWTRLKRRTRTLSFRNFHVVAARSSTPRYGPASSMIVRASRRQRLACRELGT